MNAKNPVLMIVEDDPSSRTSLGSIFSRRGWVICSAGTLSGAMSLLDHGLVPDCLLLDLVLPDGNGEEVLRKVRDGGLKTRVAVCTGAQDPRAIRAGSGRCTRMVYFGSRSISTSWRASGIPVRNAHPNWSEAAQEPLLPESPMPFL